MANYRFGNSTTGMKISLVYLLLCILLFGHTVPAVTAKAPTTPTTTAIASSSKAAISNVDPFLWGWKDAYDYSHKWGYYRGYHDAQAQQHGAKIKAGLSDSIAINRAPPPHPPRVKSASNAYYKKGWELAHQTAAKRGYQEGYQHAKGGRPYQKQPTSTTSRPSSSSPPPSLLQDEYHAGWRAVYHRSYEMGYKAGSTATSSKNSADQHGKFTSSRPLQTPPPPPQVPPGCETSSNFVKGWNQSHEYAWYKGYEAAIKAAHSSKPVYSSSFVQRPTIIHKMQQSKNSPKSTNANTRSTNPSTAPTRKNYHLLEIGSAVSIAAGSQLVQQKRAAAAPYAANAATATTRTTNRVPSVSVQFLSQRMQKSLRLRFAVLCLVDIIFWAWCSQTWNLPANLFKHHP